MGTILRGRGLQILKCRAERMQRCLIFRKVPVHGRVSCKNAPLQSGEAAYIALSLSIQLHRRLPQKSDNSQLGYDATGSTEKELYKQLLLTVEGHLQETRPWTGTFLKMRQRCI